MIDSSTKSKTQNNRLKDENNNKEFIQFNSKDKLIDRQQSCRNLSNNNKNPIVTSKSDKVPQKSISFIENSDESSAKIKPKKRVMSIHELPKNIQAVIEDFHIDETIQFTKNITIDKDIMLKRKYFDEKCWNSLCRPADPKSSAICSIVSTFNQLYSKIGQGKLQPITQDDALSIVGYKKPYDEVNNDEIDNENVIKYFNKICKYKKVEGSALILYQNVNINDQDAIKTLKCGLLNNKYSFVYHCHNNFMPIIGQEDSVDEPTDAQQVDSDNKIINNWLMLGQNSRYEMPIVFKKQTDIIIDLSQSFPQQQDIKNPDLGIMKQEDKIYNNKNNHCILLFQKI